MAKEGDRRHTVIERLAERQATGTRAQNDHVPMLLFHLETI
jgi:hypothetical protein